MKTIFLVSAASVVFWVGCIFAAYQQGFKNGKLKNYPCPACPDFKCPEIKLQEINLEKLKNFRGTINLYQGYNCDTLKYIKK